MKYHILNRDGLTIEHFREVLSIQFEPILPTIYKFAENQNGRVSSVFDLDPHSTEACYFCTWHAANYPEATIRISAVNPLKFGGLFLITVSCDKYCYRKWLFSINEENESLEFILNLASIEVDQFYQLLSAEDILQPEPSVDDCSAVLTTIFNELEIIRLKIANWRTLNDSEYVMRIQKLRTKGILAIKAEYRAMFNDTLAALGDQTITDHKTRKQNSLGVLYTNLNRGNQTASLSEYEKMTIGSMKQAEKLFRVLEQNILDLIYDLDKTDA